MSVADTIATNTAEMGRAAEILGIDEIIELGWETDRLGDASEVALRERFIYHVRRVRPYAVMSFDPYGAFHEDNQDHIKVAHAVDETYWTAQFDKHHPEHFHEGLAPHGVYERWYFARRVVEVTTPVDISSTLDRKVDAALAHDTMLRHFVNQLRLQARTGGHEIAELERAQKGDLRPFMEPLIRGGARATGQRHGLAAAEEFRVVRFGGLERVFGIGSKG
jgi:LmbE family N-acetylglucosaminyl deacetylase